MSKLILSLEHTPNWSWAKTFSMMSKLSRHEYRRAVTLRNPVVSEILLDYDVVLVQNGEIMTRMGTLENTIVRMAGMMVDRLNPGDRYDHMLKDAAGVIATNPQLFEIAKRANDNTVLIPNGVDLNIFRPPKHRPQRRFTIGFSGNITTYSAEYKGWRFYIMAHVSLWNDVGHKECLYGLPPDHCQAQLDHFDMPTGFYHQIDCLILPSLNEGCSNTISEALACGTPVVCTKVGYHGAMLQDRENVMFCSRDVDDICEKVMEIKSDTLLQERLRSAGRDFAERNQDINVIARQYDDMIEATLCKE